MALTAKQRLFVDEYIKHRNATKAAINAGYSEKSAANIGYENVRKLEIAEEIERRFQASAMSAAEAAMLLSEHARADMGPYLDSAGYVDFDKLKEDGKTHLIKQYEVVHMPSGKVKVKIRTYDAQNAVLNVLKLHGEFDKRGSEDDPLNIVNWDPEEWKRKQAERLDKANETMSVFEDEDA